jgi:vacuolar-type H+-ATPase subunit I/STV1
MTEPTSPTNLNADLDSSVEQTNQSNESNSELRSELISELPSSIRLDETTEFSPNIQQFDSPPAPQSEESEDATARLLRIRNELTQRIRERDAEELQRQIQQEIDELQSSLDRRHRRQSDHYADLTYDERFPNYDVPQAPSSN